MRIDGRKEQRVAEHREPARNAAAAKLRVECWRVGINPEDLPRCRLESKNVVALSGVHDAVDDQRRGLVVIEPSCLKHPLQLEALRIGGRDLGQLAVALAHVATGIREPVLWLLLRIQDALGRQLRKKRVARSPTTWRPCHGCQGRGQRDQPS